MYADEKAIEKVEIKYVITLKKEVLYAE